MSQRPFRILGVQQIAVGAPDRTRLEKLWCDLLGIPAYKTYKNTNENVNELILHLGKDSSRVEIDLMQPIDPEKSPKVHLPPLNHIGLWVDKLQEAMNYLEQKGVRFTPGGIRKGASGYPVCFIHPKGNEESPLGGEGVLIELVEAPSGLFDSSIK